MAPGSGAQRAEADWYWGVAEVRSFGEARSK
eukprot:CAMPEP_0195063424 /NCGR_PEP_ID=MMETSP0448-20130528/9793_1 /TAXON_ID=66468 /ORGANISM="Heterocapsa triquestra, Strain CCMP 448" /LENGTH=30 /DNA_ID= /DNA_START= /DNA_END= /DNA_ORIENTATION=